MNTPNLYDAAKSVVDGTQSLTAAAKAAGVYSAKLRYYILGNPELSQAYKALQDKTPERRAFIHRKLDLEDLKEHPAVVDVVQNGMTYAAAAEKHGVNTQTLYWWIKRAYSVAPKRKKVWEKALEDQQDLDLPEAASQPQPPLPDSTSAALTIAQASIQAAATVLGLTYHQVLAKLLEQAPPPDLIKKSNQATQAHVVDSTSESKP